MKKILFLLTAAAVFLVAGTQSAKAQTGAPSPYPKLLTTTAFGNSLDTVDNTEQHVTTPALGKTTVWGTGLTAKVITKKISGTVGGTLVLQGSMDGTEWVTIGSAASVTDASNNYGFNTTVKWYYYRISWTGTGTMSASMKCYFLWY